MLGKAFSNSLRFSHKCHILNNGLKQRLSGPSVGEGELDML